MAAQWQLAWRMYLAHLLTLAYSPQIFLNIIQRVLGNEAAALFGFLRNLQVQISGYLPATLFFNLIRPKLVASYVGGGGIAQLTHHANLAGKLSLFALMPLVVLSALMGEDLVALLSGHKFVDSGWLLAGFMIALVPFSQRQLYETIAVTTGHTRLCTWAAASGLALLPAMWGLLQVGFGQWAAILALGLGHMLFNTIVAAGVSKAEGYRPDWLGLGKLALCALGAYAAVVWLPLDNINVGLMSLRLNLILQFSLAVLAYLSIAWWLKPFSFAERNGINSFAGRRIFVW